MRKVWKVSIVAKAKHVVDLLIDEVQTSQPIEADEQNHETPGGAFDSVVYVIRKVSSEDEVFSMISSMFKQNFTFSDEAKETYKPYFYKAKHNRPDLFI